MIGSITRPCSRGSTGQNERVDEQVAEAEVQAEPATNGHGAAPLARPPEIDDVPAPTAVERRERGAAPSWRWTRRDRTVAIFVAVGLLIGIPIGLWVLGKIDTGTPKGTVTEIGTIAGSRGPADAQPVQVEGAPLPTAAPGAATDPAIGKPAPRVSGYGFDGRPLQIDPAGGRKLVVMLSPECDSCSVDMVNLMSWREQGRAPEGLEVWTVSTGSKPGSANDPPSEWFKGKGWNFAVIADSADGAAAKAYGTSVFPTLLMIDQQGTVVHRMTGPVDLDELDSAVATYLPPG
jgi:hypothetical protein